VSDKIIGTELTCQQIIDYIMAYLDGELPDREQAIFAAHMAICPECQNYLNSYKTSVELCKKSASVLGLSPASIAVPEDLIKAILASRTTENSDNK
jgi:anti-sigma factor RsiW